MNRRAFFGGIAALCVSPTLPTATGAVTVTGTISAADADWYDVDCGSLGPMRRWANGRLITPELPRTIYVEYIDDDCDFGQAA